MTNKKRTTVRAIMILTACAGLCMPGCDEQDAASVALQEATAKLGAFGSVVDAQTQDRRSSDLKALVTQLEGVTRDGTAAQKGAASLLLSKAKATQGEYLAAQASELERNTLSEIAHARSALSIWTSLHARANALNEYDPSSELADLKKQSDDLAAQRQKALQRRGETQAKIDELSKQIEGKAALVKAKREEELGIRQRLAAASASAGEEIIKEATRVKREGDAIEKEQAALEAQVAQSKPILDEIALEVGRIETQQQLVVRAGEQVNTRAESAQSDAAALQAEAATTGEELEKILASIAAAREGAIKERTAGALEAYGKATAAAKSAQEMSRTQATAGLSLSQQAVGEVNWLYGQGLGAARDLFTAAGAVAPALPGQTSHAAKGAQFGEERTVAFGAAREAYEQTMDSIAKLAGKGDEDVRRVEQVQKRLADLRFILSDGKDDVRNGANGASSASEGDAATEAAPVENTGGAAAMPDKAQAEQEVKQFLTSLKDGDFVTVCDSLYSDHAELNATIPQIKETVVQLTALNDACKAKFAGKGLKDAAMLSNNPMMAGMNPAAQLEAIDPAGVTVNVIEDEAQATIEGSPMPLKFKHIDGRWKLDMRPFGPNSDNIRELPRVLGAIQKAATDTTAEVNSGTLPNIDAAVGGLMQKLQPVLNEIMGGQGGPR